MRTVEQIVKDEVIECVSTLIQTLAASQGAAYLTHDLQAAVDLAALLTSPITDWEETVWQHGWRKVVPADYDEGFADPWDDEAVWICVNHDDTDGYRPTRHEATAEKLALALGLADDPAERHPMEWHSVTDWLFCVLQEAGECVDHIAGLNVWARCSTGQAIHLDGCWDAVMAVLRDREATYAQAMRELDMH